MLRSKEQRSANEISPFSNMKLRGIKRGLGREVIIIRQVLRRQVIRLQSIESPEQRAQRNV